MEKTEKKDSKEEPLPLVSSPPKPIRKTFKTYEGQYRLAHECLHETKIAKLAKERSYKITSLSASPSFYIHPCRISLVVAKPVEYLPKSNSISNLKKEDKRERREPNDFDSNRERNEEKGISAKKEAEQCYVLNAGDSIFLQHISPPFYKLKKMADSSLRFRVVPTCHDFNKITSTSTSLALVIGFMSGDILTYDPKTNTKTVQFNREKCISSGRVNCIQWILGSKNLFMAAFSTGNMFIFDTEREDQSFAEPLPDGAVNSFSVLHQEGKFNPVARWHISKAAINDFSFSPDGQYLAVASQDGFIRVFEFETEKYLMACRSYYGGFLCVAWSPDSKYFVTGGEDDLVSVWSFHERKLMARGRSHESFISRVVFDPWNCTDERYRFASAGQDARLNLWDFAVSELHLPRSRSNTGTSPLKKPSESLLNEVLESSVQNKMQTTVIPAKLNSETPFLRPLVSHKSHAEPISDVVFIQEAMITVCWGGITKYWCRPSFLPKVPELDESEKQLHSNRLNSSSSSLSVPQHESPTLHHNSTQELKETNETEQNNHVDNAQPKTLPESSNGNGTHNTATPTKDGEQNGFKMKRLSLEKNSHQPEEVEQQ